MDAVYRLRFDDCGHDHSIHCDNPTWTVFLSCCRSGVKPGNRAIRTVSFNSAPSLHGWVDYGGRNRLWSPYMVGVLLCGIGLLLIYAYRIRVEEKVLVRHFGGDMWSIGSGRGGCFLEYGNEVTGISKGQKGESAITEF